MAAKKGNLPNLIIIGAVKCGTTSLHYYLGLHPQIFMSREKELNFSVRERNWDKGIEWYRSNFRVNSKIRGETSPAYSGYPFLKGVPERMHAVIPDAKLIYIVRDPIERIISGYVQRYSDGRENRTIEEVLKYIDDSTPFLIRSRYYLQLSQYLDYFPRSSILIITTEDLHHARWQTLQKVFKFLDVDDMFYSPKFQNIKHRSNVKRRKNRIGIFLRWLSETRMGKIFSVDLRRRLGRVLYLPFSKRIDKPEIEQRTRRELINYFKDDINRLRDFTGREFRDWCV